MNAIRLKTLLFVSILLCIGFVVSMMSPNTAYACTPPAGGLPNVTPSVTPERIVDHLLYLPHYWVQDVFVEENLWGSHQIVDDYFCKAR